MLYRLRTNFRLSVMTLLAGCALVGITPFAVWRLARGDYLIGVVDTAILVAVIASVVYAWRTNDTARAGLLLVFVICAGSATAATLAGDVGLAWVYPALLASFFLTSPNLAGLFAVASVLFLAFHGAAFNSPEQMWSFVMSALVLSASAYVFSLRNESQRSRLEQLALRDPLTGVGNRRAMDEELQRAIETHARNNVPYGVAVVDLDHFKTVNDRHGHGVGDQILLDFAAVLEASTRRSDQVFRFGGEEFVLLFSGVDGKGLYEVVAHIQSEIKKTLKSPSGPVTASFGLAVLNAKDSADSWFARADLAVYQAKKAGRDCIIVADGDGEPQPDYPLPRFGKEPEPEQP